MSIFKKNKSRQVKRATDPIEANLPVPQVPELPKRKRRWWKWLLVIFGILIILAALVAASVYFYINATVLKGEKEGRINILVLGVDDAATLSDTMMLVSIDTRRGEDTKAALISVPRDLYVNIPEFGQQKINAAYTYGQNNHYPGGGPALTSRTLSQVTGQTIDYYVAMDFTGFKELVNAVGGVDVNVKTAITDPYYPDYKGGYAPFSISKGPHHLDGESALRYARSRKTSTDFDRAARQQQIVLAFRSKLLSRDTLLNRGRIDTIKQILRDHLKTNLNWREAAKLGEILHRIPKNQITRHVIDSSNLLVPNPGFGYSLVPRAGPFNYSEIKAFVAKIFETNKNTLPESQR